MPVLELKTWPAGSAWSRGMGKPLCSLLEAECVLPLLRTLLQSSWSSRCLSTDRLSFSIQLSVEDTGSQTKPLQPARAWGRGKSTWAVMWIQKGHLSVTSSHNYCDFETSATDFGLGINFYWPQKYVLAFSLPHEATAQTNTDFTMNSKRALSTALTLCSVEITLQILTLNWQCGLVLSRCQVVTKRTVLVSPPTPPCPHRSWETSGQH